MSRTKLKISTPAIIVVIVSFGIGLVWGLRMSRSVAPKANLVGATSSKDVSPVHVLAYKNMFDAKLLALFDREQSASQTNSDRRRAIELDEVTTADEFMQRLRDPSNHYDLILFFSYQIFEISAVHRGTNAFAKLDRRLLPNFTQVSPDFQMSSQWQSTSESILDGSTAVPLLWGVMGWAERDKEAALATRKKRNESANEQKSDQWLSARRANPFLSDNATQETAKLFVNWAEMAFQPLRQPEWRFHFARSGTTRLWLILAAIPSDARTPAAASDFLNFLLQPEAARSMIESSHQASTLRDLDREAIDDRLKPNALRSVSLTSLKFLDSLSRMTRPESD